MVWTGCEPRAGLRHRLHPGPPDAVGGRRLGGTGFIRPTTSQPTGRKRRAGGWSAVRRIPDGAVHWRDNQWGIPCKRALFVSDGPDSTSSGSDIVEDQFGGPSDDGYPGIANSGRLQEVHLQKELHSPSRQLEDAVVRLQQDIADYRTELRLNRTQSPAVSSRPMERSGFTSTPVPRFSRRSSWEQYRQVFEAIVRSNGWDDVTAALQLLSHLDGDALNVALLGSGVSAGVAGIFSEILVRSLQFSRAVGRIQASV